MAKEKRKIWIFALLAAILGVLSGCGEKEAQDIAVKSAVPGDAVHTAEKENRYPAITSLVNGEVEILAGFPFGEPFDYELFHESGEDFREGARITVYSRTDGDNSIRYLFEGEGHRFSGMYFHLQGKVTRERFCRFFGEPDREKEEDERGESYLEYHYEMADLRARFTDGYLREIDYTATEKGMEQKPLSDEPTDLEGALAEGYDSAEAVYEWSILDIDIEAYYYPEGEEENQSEAFIEDFLQSQGMEGMVPEEVICNQDGDPLVKYYIDGGGERYCFVFYRWGDYWVDYEAGISEYTARVYCVLCDRENVGRAGSLIRRCDDETDAVREIQFDAWGVRLAEVSYEKREGVLFPLVGEYWRLNRGEFLCRDQKICFYADAAEFDEEGRMTGYQGGGDRWDGKRLFWYPCEFFYDEEDRLARIGEEMQGEDIERGRGTWSDYSADIDFVYNGDGTLRSAKYSFSEWTHGGTADSSGRIWYDTKGRMIYNDFYITHGRDASIFLYHGDEERPWARLDWCSSGPGFERILLFEPME